LVSKAADPQSLKAKRKKKYHARNSTIFNSTNPTVKGTP
jgi:hypothetical protein